MLYSNYVYQFPDFWNESHRQDLLKEISSLEEVGNHKNIVKLMGAVKNNPGMSTFYLVFDNFIRLLKMYFRPIQGSSQDLRNLSETVLPVSIDSYLLSNWLDICM